MEFVIEGPKKYDDTPDAWRALMALTDAYPDWREECLWFAAVLGGEAVAVAGVNLVWRPGLKRAWVGPCFVLPAHRGHGLQRRLVRERLACVANAGLASAETTVSVKNGTSLVNMLECGFEPQKYVSGSKILSLLWVL